MVMLGNRHDKTNAVHELKPSRLEPLSWGCQFADMLRLYRLSETERQRFHVERDNPGLIVVVA